MNSLTLQNPMIMNYSPLHGPIRHTIPPIPSFFGNLTLLLGAGDIVHNGLTNVEQFGSYNILICLPSNEESFLKNVEKLTDSGPMICIIDVSSASQMALFIEHFRGRFSVIDGHWGHVPHFSLDTLEALLTEGGSASNIFEQSINIVNITTFLTWIKNEYINSYSNIAMSTTKLVSNGSMVLNESDARNLQSVLIEKIRFMNSCNKNIHLSEEVLVSLPSYPYYTLQKIFGSLLHDRITPLNLLGTVGMHRPAWASEEKIELVLRKSSPFFWENLLAAYSNTYGRNEHVERAELILDGIRHDMEHYMIWQSKAKYATFLKHMRNNILPFLHPQDLPA